MNLTIEMPDDLVRTLERIATAQSKTVQQVAVERLRFSVGSDENFRPGSPAALLRAMTDPPHPAASDIEELDAVMAGGRIPYQSNDFFTD